MVLVAIDQSGTPHVANMVVEWISSRNRFSLAKQVHRLPPVDTHNLTVLSVDPLRSAACAPHSHPLLAASHQHFPSIVCLSLLSLCLSVRPSDLLIFCSLLRAMSDLPPPYSALSPSQQVEKKLEILRGGATSAGETEELVFDPVLGQLLVVRSVPSHSHTQQVRLSVVGCNCFSCSAQSTPLSSPCSLL
jgi:hypothetical protein